MTPRTAAATRAVIRKGQETKADELRAAGWLVIAPDDPREVLVTDDGRVYCTDDRCLKTAAPRGPVRVARLYDSLASGLNHMDRHAGETP